MSVFNEFQKLWSQKFPNSSLSEEWKEDVRISLEKHKEKIESLEKEIEKEKLYCLYLEKLLSDAESSKNNGTDALDLTKLTTNQEIVSRRKTMMFNVPIVFSQLDENISIFYLTEGVYCVFFTCVYER